MIGVDLSHWNKEVDFNILKQEGYEFVILKAGGWEGKTKTGHKDEKFEEYYKKASEAGFKIGVYYFVGTQFRSKEQGLNQAKHCLGLIAGKKINFGVWLDVEKPCSPLYKKQQTEAAVAFCQFIEDHHYFTGIYGSDISTFGTGEKGNGGMLIYEDIKRFALWVARYGKKPNHNHAIQQITSKGISRATDTRIDIDIARYDISKYCN